jgi:phage gp16-like protein
MKTKSQIDAQRKSDLARIHIAKAQLRLDDECYRDMLFQITGHRSAADLDARQRYQVLDRMKQCGWLEQNDAARKHPGRPRNIASVPMLRKVEALLADAKRPWEYARAMAEKMFKVAKLEWLQPDQLHKLVAALQADANRRAKEKS